MLGNIKIIISILPENPIFGSIYMKCFCDQKCMSFETNISIDSAQLQSTEYLFVWKL